MDSRFYSKAILQTELCFFPGPLGGWLKLKTIFRSKWTNLQLIKCLERRAKLELLLKNTRSYYDFTKRTGKFGKSTGIPVFDRVHVQILFQCLYIFFIIIFSSV